MDIEFNYEFIHFGLTSQDINSLANIMRLRFAVNSIIIPKIDELVDLLKIMAKDNIILPMLSRTQGQPASPTLL